MSSSDVLNFPCNGYPGVDLNVYLGGYTLSWTNENMAATDSNPESPGYGNDIRVVTKLTLDYGIVIRPDISAQRAQGIDLRGLDIAWYDCHPGNQFDRLSSGNFTPGLNKLTSVYTMGRKTKIRARNLGQPILFEVWYSLNDSKYDLNPDEVNKRGYNNYTFFGSNKSEHTSLTDTEGTIPSISIEGGQIKNYVAGIFSTNVELFALATRPDYDLSEVIAAVRYIYTERLLEIILKGVVVSSVIITPLTSISGKIDTRCYINKLIIGDNKSNIAGISVIANGQPALSFNADWDIFLHSHNTSGLIDTFLVKQGFYVDMTRGYYDNNVDYSLCPMMTLPYFPIPTACCLYPCYYPDFLISSMMRPRINNLMIFRAFDDVGTPWNFYTMLAHLSNKIPGVMYIIRFYTNTNNAGWVQIGEFDTLGYLQFAKEFSIVITGLSSLFMKATVEIYEHPYIMDESNIVNMLIPHVPINADGWESDIVMPDIIQPTISTITVTDTKTEPDNLINLTVRATAADLMPMHFYIVTLWSSINNEDWIQLNAPNIDVEIDNPNTTAQAYYDSSITTSLRIKATIKDLHWFTELSEKIQDIIPLTPTTTTTPTTTSTPTPLPDTYSPVVTDGGLVTNSVDTIELEHRINVTQNFTLSRMLPNVAYKFTIYTEVGDSGWIMDSEIRTVTSDITNVSRDFTYIMETTPVIAVKVTLEDIDGNYLPSNLGPTLIAQGNTVVDLIPHPRLYGYFTYYAIDISTNGEYYRRYSLETYLKNYSADRSYTFHRYRYRYGAWVNLDNWDANISYPIQNQNGILYVHIPVYAVQHEPVFLLEPSVVFKVTVHDTEFPNLYDEFYGTITIPVNTTTPTTTPTPLLAPIISNISASNYPVDGDTIVNVLAIVTAGNMLPLHFYEVTLFSSVNNGDWTQLDVSNVDIEISNPTIYKYFTYDSAIATSVRVKATIINYHYRGASSELIYDLDITQTPDTYTPVVTEGSRIVNSEDIIGPDQTSVNVTQNFTLSRMLPNVSYRFTIYSEVGDGGWVMDSEHTVTSDITNVSRDFTYIMETTPGIAVKVTLEDIAGNYTPSNLGPIDIVPPRELTVFEPLPIPRIYGLYVYTSNFAWFPTYPRPGSLTDATMSYLLYYIRCGVRNIVPNRLYTVKWYRKFSGVWSLLDTNNNFPFQGGGAAEGHIPVYTIKFTYPFAMESSVPVKVTVQDNEFPHLYSEGYITIRNY